MTTPSHVEVLARHAVVDGDLAEVGLAGGVLAAVPQKFAYALQALIDVGGAPGAPVPTETSVEVAEWESAEARAAHLQQAAASGVYRPLTELLDGPFRASVLQRLG